MDKKNENAVVFGLLGGILIGLGVFFWKSGGQNINSNIEILNSKTQSDSPQGRNSKTETQRTNINIATQVELEALPKIGEVTARKIINGRPFVTTSELVERKIMGERAYEEIKDLVSVE